jgi:hypothetical protein
MDNTSPRAERAAETAAHPEVVGPDELPDDEVLDRSEIARFVRASVFPATRSALVESAREQDAPASVLARLRRLPDDGEFGNVAAIWEALGHRTEHRPTG